MVIMAQRRGDIPAVPAQALNAASTSNTCELWAVDTTCDLVCTTASLMEPEIKGHEHLNLPTYAFYIHNTRLSRQVLFDNGSRKDWWNTAPSVLPSHNDTVPGIHVKHDVYDILVAGGVDPGSIEAVVWSHYHFDHIGNMELFPRSTDIIVGPGFQTLLPGYPERKDAPFHQTDIEGRNLRELTFDNSASKIGPFPAHDYFGDGSFYLLDTPGHTVGHLSGLVRTTPTTFVFLGADISHFPGMYRPTPYAPLPETIPAETVLDARLRRPCPCSLFTVCHMASDPVTARTTPFYQVSADPDSCDDREKAQHSIDGLKEFDADENVFVAIAHDPALREVGNFPEATLNDWKAQGWGKKLHWNFLNELPLDGKPGRPKLVSGLIRDGKHSKTR